MANNDVSGGEIRTGAPRQTLEQQVGRSEGGTQPESTNFATYSFSSPEFRQATRRLPSGGEQSRATGVILVADNTTASRAAAPEVPTLLRAPAAAVEIPALLRAPKATEPALAPLVSPGKSADQPVEPAVPVAPAEQMEDLNKTVDPCTRKVINAIPAPADRPKILDSVKDRDPELFKQIQAKVTDPRYTGELGNITVSTHNKKGQVDGCIYVQNVPYWESGPATQALLNVNKELAAKGKKLETDPLNGAGRTLGQEEAIVWRNSGLHAKVGKSNHGFGKADDWKLDPDPNAKKQPWEDPVVNTILHANGWRQGDSWGPLKNDLHHWSFVGPGPATDGHAPPHKPIHGAHHRHR